MIYLYIFVILAIIGISSYLEQGKVQTAGKKDRVQAPRRANGQFKRKIKVKEFGKVQGYLYI
jgi:hypothetical protein